MTKTAVVAVAVVGLAGAAAVSARSAAHPTVTRAQAVRRLGGLLGAKPQQVRLVWADEKTTDVVLEWTAYAPHARIPELFGPIQTKGNAARSVHGPANAWLAADGGPPEGVGTIDPRHRAHHYAEPGRTYSISVALLRKLSAEHLNVRLTPLRVQPGISCKRALELLGSQNLEPQRIWLVFANRRTAWLAAIRHGRYALLDASSGKLIER